MTFLEAPSHEVRALNENEIMIQCLIQKAYQPSLVFVHLLPPFNEPVEKLDFESSPS
jgi:hypothetical protein